MSAEVFVPRRGLAQLSQPAPPGTAMICTITLSVLASTGLGACAPALPSSPLPATQQVSASATTPRAITITQVIDREIRSEVQRNHSGAQTRIVRTAVQNTPQPVRGYRALAASVRRAVATIYAPVRISMRPLMQWARGDSRIVHTSDPSRPLVQTGNVRVCGRSGDVDRQGSMS